MGNHAAHATETPFGCAASTLQYRIVQCCVYEYTSVLRSSKMNLTYIPYCLCFFCPVPRYSILDCTYHVVP